MGTWKRKWVQCSVSESWPFYWSVRVLSAAPQLGCLETSGWSSWLPQVTSLSYNRLPWPQAPSSSVPPPPLSSPASLPVEMVPEEMVWHEVWGLVPQATPLGGQSRRVMKVSCFSKWASTASKTQRERLPTGRVHRKPQAQLGDLQRCLQPMACGLGKESWEGKARDWE